VAYALPYRRFANALASACARLGADVDRYSFIVVDLHHYSLLVSRGTLRDRHKPECRPAPVEELEAAMEALCRIFGAEAESGPVRAVSPSTEETFGAERTHEYEPPLEVFGGLSASGSPSEKLQLHPRY